MGEVEQRELRLAERNKVLQMVNEEELRALAQKWKEIAMLQVPAAYADRGLHSKYFRLDNEAAGLDSCADELLELLDRAAELPLEPTTDGTPTPPTSPHHCIATENGGTAVVYVPIQKAAGS